jgi:hypothetical protein
MILRTTLYLIVFIFISPSFVGVAQNNHYIRAAWHQGYILKHKEAVRHLVKGPVFGIELNYVKSTNGEKQWHNINHFPDIGLGFSYYDLNNDQQLGKIYGLHALMDLYLLRKTNTYFTCRLSSGIAFNTKYFDTKDNVKNNLVASPFNAFINLRWAFGYEWEKKLALEMAAGIAHTSNGAYQLPNLGINVLSSSLALKYRLNHQYKAVLKDSIRTPKLKHILQTHLSIGRRVDNVMANEIIQCASLTTQYYRAMNHSNAIGIGMDLFYRHNTVQLYDILKFQYSTEPRTFYQLGFKINYKYRAGNMDFPFEVGAYAIDKYKKNGLIYNRIGLRYHMYKGLMANVSLKLHFARADYIEWGLGYQF